MNKLVFCCVLIAIVGSALGQNRVPPGGLPPTAGLPPYPVQQGNWNVNDPNNPYNNRQDSRFAEESSYIDHRGNRERYTRVCDDRGCYERRVSSGQTRLSTSSWLFTFIAIVAGVKSLLQ